MFRDPISRVAVLSVSSFLPLYSPKCCGALLFALPVLVVPVPSLQFHFSITNYA